MTERKILRKYLKPVMRLKREYARHREYGLNWGVIALMLAIVAFWWLLLSSIANAEVYDADVIVDAIYQAEGAEKAKKPFGILSVSCNGYEDCRQVCYNTVINQFTRWQVAGSEGDFLESLARRYAPVGADNDPNNLNINWLANVRYFIAKEGE